MSKEKWSSEATGGLIIVLSFVFGIGFLIQQFSFPYPDFEEGQCMARVYEAEEFKPRHISRSFEKIVRVGRVNYLAMSYFRHRDGEVESQYSDFVTTPIMLDGKYTQVDCETGLEL